MERSSFSALIAQLNRAAIRYMVVGGIAAVAHGHVRFTADIDLFLDLSTNNLAQAAAVFRRLGYQPRAPVALEDLIDAGNRARWAQEKGMLVFSLWSTMHPATEVDLFISEPIPFADAYPRTVWMEVSPGIEAPIIGLDDLIKLKRLAARPQDLLDVQRLLEFSENQDA